MMSFIKSAYQFHHIVFFYTKQYCQGKDKSYLSQCIEYRTNDAHRNAARILYIGSPSAENLIDILLKELL